MRAGFAVVSLLECLVKLLDLRVEVLSVLSLDEGVSLSRSGFLRLFIERHFVRGSRFGRTTSACHTDFLVVIRR